MAVISLHAEESLLENLQALAGERAQWSLTVLLGSQMDVVLQRLLALTESQIVLMGMARDAGMAAFMLHDSDIALLHRGSMQDSAEALHAVIHEIFPHLAPQHVQYDSFYHTFPLIYDYDHALEWAENKLRTWMARSAHAEAHKKRQSSMGAWNDAAFRSVVRERTVRKRPLVAVIEDDNTLRQLARNVLREEYDVVLAHNGLEALELYSASAPDLIFLDINMPLLDGISTLERIMKADPDALVIMFSSQSSEAMLKRALALGAKGFVAKPFTSESLLGYARSALAGSASRRTVSLR